MAAPYYTNLELPFKEGDIIKLEVGTPPPGKFYSLSTSKEEMYFTVDKIKKDVPEGRFRAILSAPTGSSVLENQYDYVLMIDFFKIANNNFQGSLSCAPNWNRNLPECAFKAKIIV